MTSLSPEARQRLETEANIWISTVRPDGRPHLTPVWFVWHADKVYACIQGRSVKTNNLDQNPHAALALEDGSSVVICEGMIQFIEEPWPTSVADLFRAKYNWDITTDHDYNRLLEVTPVKWLIW